MRKTIVDFISDAELLVKTARGEELKGYLARRQATTEDEKTKIAEIVEHCFDISDTCCQAIDRIPLIGLEMALKYPIYFEFIVRPIEAQRRRIGNRIREIREGKGMSARELAFLCHIDPSNLSKIESGKHAAGLDILNRIAYFLGAEVQINLKTQTENNQLETPIFYDSMM